MKNSALFLLLVFLAAACGPAKDRFTLSGTVKGADTGMVYLQKIDQDKWVNVDSAKLEKGAFTFKGKVTAPEMWHILMMDGQVMVPVFIENAPITVEIYADSVEKSTVTGSATHDIYKSYLALNDKINVRMDSVYEDYKKAKEAHDTAAMKRADSVSNLLDGEMKKQLVDFVKSHPATVVSPYLVVRNSWQFELPELEEVAASLDTSLASTTYAQNISKRIAILKSVEVGQTAPDFEMADSTGKQVRLSSLKGKVLLVDFWASWCSPCRAENPNVVKAYKAYNKKGFDVLGVSFDQNRDKWIRATKDDNLTWAHVSDLKGWGNAAGKLYGINSIPANVLLDKDQKIIGRNLRGEDLMKKLEEVLGPAGKK